MTLFSVAAECCPYLQDLEKMYKANFIWSTSRGHSEHLIQKAEITGNLHVGEK